MEKIKLKYEEHKSKPSDINEHLETIYNFSNECSHITEMGVRWVSSTWPMLLSKPKKMISYDIVKHPQIEEVINLAKEYNIDYSFEIKDVLNIEIESTELLFIDTLHTYNQLINELTLHSSMVSKYIILHDTEHFGRLDETIYSHASDKIKSQQKTKQGLMTAVEDFLKTDSGQYWEIFQIYANNNGLTILKNKNYKKD